jgi:hypothetical protein
MGVTAYRRDGVGTALGDGGVLGRKRAIRRLLDGTYGTNEYGPISPICG